MNCSACPDLALSPPAPLPAGLALPRCTLRRTRDPASPSQQVSDHLLIKCAPQKRKEQQTLFFAAHTLHYKIQHQFRSLPQGASASLRTSMLNHCLRYRAGTGAL